MSSSTFLVWLLPFAVNSQNVKFSLDPSPEYQTCLSKYRLNIWTWVSNRYHKFIISKTEFIFPPPPAPDETHPSRVPYLNKWRHSNSNHQSGSYPTFSRPLTPISYRCRSLSRANCNSQISTMLSCSLHSYSPTSFQSLSLLIAFTLKCFQSFLPQSCSNHPSNFWIWSHYFSAQNSSVAPHCFQYEIWTPAAGSQFHSHYTQMYNDISLLCFLERIWSCSQCPHPAG